MWVSLEGHHHAAGADDICGAMKLLEVAGCQFVNARSASTINLEVRNLNISCSGGRRNGVWSSSLHN